MSNAKTDDHFAHTHDKTPTERAEADLYHYQCPRCGVLRGGHMSNCPTLRQREPVGSKPENGNVFFRDDPLGPMMDRLKDVMKGELATPVLPVEQLADDAFRTPEERTKATNPKDAVGTGKVPFSTVPARVAAEIGLAMLEGARKYGRHNYRIAGVRASVYYDAAMRHLGAWWEGQDIDPDSGLPHIVKALASLAVLRDAQNNGMCTDDRPPSVSDVNWVAGLNATAQDIIARYPDAKPPFTKDSIKAEGWGGDGVSRN